MSLKSTFGVTFYINRSKEKKNGECPVMMRININGQKLALQVHRFIKPDEWNVSKYQMIGRTPRAKVFNEYIDAIRLKAFKKYNELLSMYDEVSPQLLRDAILGVNSAKPKMIIEVWEDYIITLQKLIGKENSYATYQKYVLAKKYFQEFLLKEYKVADISIKQVNHLMVTGFSDFLKIEKNYGHNTAIKLLQKLKKITSNAIKNGWVVKDPFAEITFNIKEVIRPYLTEKELGKLIDFNSNFDRLNRVKDFFLFSCFTGLAYIDIKQLKRREIEEIENGLWIKTHRQKTGNRSNVPLLKIPLDIINKYVVLDALNPDDPVLPIMSNQKLNAYLKELADMCEIKKELTFHVARHTFATTVTMTFGVPMESVSKMLGHKKISTTQIYARIVDSKLGEDMQILSQKLNLRYASNH